MPPKAKVVPAEAEKPRRIWRDALRAFEHEERFTAGDVADEMGISYASAAKLLRQLAGWGHIRITGFENPTSGHGRRRKLYEMTEHGRRAANYKK